MQTQLTARYAVDEAAYRLYLMCRRGAEHWGVPLVTAAAIIVAIGVSASLVIGRIDAGTTAAVHAQLTVAAFAATGR